MHSVCPLRPGKCVFCVPTKERKGAGFLGETGGGTRNGACGKGKARLPDMRVCRVPQGRTVPEKPGGDGVKPE